MDCERYRQSNRLYDQSTTPVAIDGIKLKKEKILVSIGYVLDITIDLTASSDRTKYSDQFTIWDIYETPAQLGPIRYQTINYSDGYAITSLHYALTGDGKEHTSVPEFAAQSGSIAKVINRDGSYPTMILKLKLAN